MAAKNKPSQAVRLLHKEMVEKIGKYFPIPGDDWRTICNQVEMLELLSAKDMGKVESMEDLFIKLVKSKDNNITYGKYEEIFDIINEGHVEAGQIITDYTTRIKKAFKAKDSDPDPETEEERSSKGNKGKRKHSTGTDTDTEVTRRQSKQVKGYLKQSRDADSGSGADGRKSSRKTRNAGNFRKPNDDTHCAKIVYTWQKAMDAVGLIQGPAFSGTGFRVGKDKIMTACHVMYDIAKSDRDAGSDLSNLKNDNVSITFNFLRMNDPNNTRKFHFEKPCCYDPIMDFAILQLRNEDEAEEPSYPNQIQRFKRVNTDQTFALLGHPSPSGLPQPMQLDPKVQIVDQESDQWRTRREDMEDWWDRKEKTFDYKFTKDEKKVLFDCWVQHGASGSPGIEMNSNGEPVCSLMLICGYTGSALDGEYEIKKADHPYMIEQGVTMEAIAEYLDRHWEKDLKHDIFAENSFK